MSKLNTCLFCDFVAADKAGLMLHSASCPKHPLWAEVELLRGELDLLRGQAEWVMGKEEQLRRLARRLAEALQSQQAETDNCCCGPPAVGCHTEQTWDATAAALALAREANLIPKERPRPPRRSVAGPGAARHGLAGPPRPGAAGRASAGRGLAAMPRPGWAGRVRAGQSWVAQRPRPRESFRAPRPL